MTLQKYRADNSYVQSDGSTKWYTDWMGGPTLAKVANCRVATLVGEPRVTAYVTGKADTYFSIPAKFHFAGKVLNGYITSDDDGNFILHHCYY